MKMSLAGLLVLKPFDESLDAPIAGKVYSNSTLLTIGVVWAFILAAAALILVIVKHTGALEVLAVAVAVSAVTSGMEWNAGLRARALNQLLITVLVAIGIVAISSA